MRNYLRKTVGISLVLSITLTLLGGIAPASATRGLKTQAEPLAFFTEAPPIVSVSPIENATEVPLTTDIKVSFSANMKNCDFTNVFTLTDEHGNTVSGPGNYDDPSKTYTFSPSGLLTNQTLYNASFYMNQGGQCVAEKDWSFTTLKILDHTVPQNGSVDVSKGTSIRSYYSFDAKNMCRSIEMTVLADGQPVGGVLETYSSPDYYSEFIPDNPFYYLATVEATISLGGSDVCNYAHTWSFEIEEDPTSVFLLYFIGTPYPSLDGVLLEWETILEVNNAGFNLYRTEDPDGEWTKLNQYLIPSVDPGGMLGGYYSWGDEDSIVEGNTYYYMLEDVDFSGYKTQHPIIEVFVG